MRDRHPRPAPATARLSPRCARRTARQKPARGPRTPQTPTPATAHAPAGVPSQVNAVAAVLPATVNPANASIVAVSYPADILKAEVAAKGAYNGLLLGLGAVALLVGGVGIANVMVISVLERRSEIGLRRALGATRRHVAEQFLAEALLLSALGGLAGTIIGAASTGIYAASQHWSVQIPAVALYGGLGAALVIGAIAGLYPSMRAARLSPTEALRTV